MRGQSKLLGERYLDVLAYFTAVYPDASEEERHWRLDRGNEWLESPQLRRQFPDVLAYCHVAATSRPEEVAPCSDEKPEDLEAGFDIDRMLAEADALIGR